jgi:hypothetical protein
MSEEKPVVTPDDKTPEPEEKLSPAEELELARLKAATAEAEARVATLERENRDLTLVGTFEREIAATGIRSHLPQKELLKLVTTQAGAKVVPSADGSELHCGLNGQPVKFSDLLETFALANSHMFDGRSLKRLRVDEHLVRSLEDLPDRQDKIEYIKKFGDDAFGKLPAHPVAKVADPSRMTRQQYLSLSIAERAKLCSELSEEQLARIHQRQEKK